MKVNQSHSGFDSLAVQMILTFVIITFIIKFFMAGIHKTLNTIVC